MAEVIQMPTPKELTDEQREYWEQQLEIAERSRVYALRMLGILGIES